MAAALGPNLLGAMIIRLVKRRATSWPWTFVLPTKYVCTSTWCMSTSTAHTEMRDHRGWLASSSTHPQEIAVSPSAVCRFPFLHASALYPSNSTKQMFYGWMEIWNGTDGFPSFLSPTTRVQGLANTLKCTYCWGTTHTRCIIHHHRLITSRHRKKNFYSELIKRVSTNEELYLIFYVDWVL